MIRISPAVVMLALACVTLIAAPPSRASDDRLTCDVFKTRLDQTITAMGDLVAHPGEAKLAYDGGETGKRFDWEGIEGLAGSLTCARTGAFEDFSIAIPESYRTSEDLPMVLKRFMELASASVCALADGAPDACRALVKTMTTGSLGQFKDTMAKGEAMPTGTRDFFIAAGVDAELDMTPVNISWSIGPGLSRTMAAVKQKLDPKNADE